MLGLGLGVGVGEGVGLGLGLGLGLGSGSGLGLGLGLGSGLGLGLGLGSGLGLGLGLALCVGDLELRGGGARLPIISLYLPRPPQISPDLRISRPRSLRWRRAPPYISLYLPRPPQISPMLGLRMSVAWPMKLLSLKKGVGETLDPLFPRMFCC